MNKKKALQIAASVAVMASLSSPVLAHSKKKHDHPHAKGKKVVQKVIRYNKYTPRQEVVYYGDQGLVTYVKYGDAYYETCQKTGKRIGRPIRLEKYHSFPYYLPYRVENNRLPRFNERSISVRFN